MVQGGAEETQALLKNRFDHIFYTGNHFHDRSEVTLASKAIILLQNQFPWPSAVVSRPLRTFLCCVQAPKRWHASSCRQPAFT